MEEEYIICEICQKKLKNLATHLSTHNYNIEKYRKEFKYLGLSRITSKETRKNMSIARIGFKASEITRQKQSAISKERQILLWKNPEYKEKIKKSLLGHKKKDTSKMNKNKPKLSDQAKKKISDKLKGITLEDRFGKEKAQEIKNRKNNSVKESKRKLMNDPIRKEIFINKMKLAAKNRIKRWKEINYKGANISKPEQKFEELLKMHDILFYSQFYIEYKDTYRKFDFLLLDYKILVEIDGTYWHGRKKEFPILNESQIANRKNDIIKNKLAKKNNFKLIRIWDDELDKGINKILEIINK